MGEMIFKSIHKFYVSHYTLTHTPSRRECSCGQYILADSEKHPPTDPAIPDTTAPAEVHPAAPRARPGVGCDCLCVEMLPDHATGSDSDMHVTDSSCGVECCHAAHSRNDDNPSSRDCDNNRDSNGCDMGCCDTRWGRGDATSASWPGTYTPPGTDAGATSSTPCSASRRQWIAVNPETPDVDQHPLFRHAHPLRVVVRAGEALYLPSLWFHQVPCTHCAATLGQTLCRRAPPPLLTTPLDHTPFITMSLRLRRIRRPRHVQGPSACGLPRIIVDFSPCCMSSPVMYSCIGTP